MNVTDVKISEIREYEGNPRKNKAAVEKVAASIAEFGWKQPVVVDRDMVIVAGHTRYLAAKSLGLETVPAVVADDLSEDEIRAYRLADNKTAEFSSWDMDALLSELDAIEMDMAQFGFDEPAAQDVPDEPEQPAEPEVVSPIYEPTPRQWPVDDLYRRDTSFDERIGAVEDGELREMLALRAAWFCDFDFAKIADYYASQATDAEKALFEELGLVVVDDGGVVGRMFGEVVS